MSTYKYPPTGGGASPYFGSPVASAASLPVSGSTGEIRVVLDTDDIYEYNGATWIKITESTADVTGPSSSVDSEIALFSGTTGKIIKRATGTGFVKVTSGVMGTPATTISLTADVAGILPVANGGTNSSTGLNNNRVMQSSGSKIVEAAGITAARALISDANGIPTHATTTATELGYVNGVTSAIQTQIDGKQPLDSDLTALAALSTTGLISRTGAGTATTRTITAASSKITIANGDGVSADPTVDVAEASLTLDNIGGTLGAAKGGTGINLSAGNGVVKVAAGVFSASTIINSNVSATAAIVRTKIANGTPNTLVYNLASTGVMSDLSAITGSRALASDANGLPVAATTTATELGYVNGVTSAIQTQIDARLCANQVIAVAGNVTLTNKAIHFVDTSSARTLTLPAPAVSSYIVIKDSTGSAATNNITIARAASEKIETVAASFVFSLGLGSVTLTSNGTDWFII